LVLPHMHCRIALGIPSAPMMPHYTGPAGVEQLAWGLTPYMLGGSQPVHAADVSLGFYSGRVGFWMSCGILESVLPESVRSR
jgi:hypothetical protein